MACFQTTSNLMPALFGLMAMSCLGMVSAGTFLGRSNSVSERDLFSDVGSVLGSGHRNFTEKRLGRIEDVLRPIFSALPKNTRGLVGHAAGSYALHRLFVQRHAWFVHGIEPAGGSWGAWNSSSPAAILENHVPVDILDLFEGLTGGRGLDVRDLALLAATFEHLAHVEAMERLQKAYRSSGLDVMDELVETEVRDILELYMLYYVIPGNATSTNPKELHERVEQQYPAWPESKRFVEEVRRSVAPTRDYFYFADVANVVEELGERYGRWQDNECRSIKHKLLAIEDMSPEGAGRVRVGDFYRAYTNGADEFQESVQYLRTLGALDESDPTTLRVIIPNYVLSPSNCVASSKYYSVCCIDECEDLLGHLERQLGAHEGLANEIAALVSALPSETTTSNRKLSLQLLRRLDEAAEPHGGRVQLHGRLFAQWMHLAYPRECPYPHVAGVTNPLTTVAWEKNESLGDWFASDEEMETFIKSTTAQEAREGVVTEVTAEASLMWSVEEELVVFRAPAMEPSMPSSVAGLRSLALVVAGLSAATAIVRTLKPDVLGLRHGHRGGQQLSMYKVFV